MAEPRNAVGAATRVDDALAPLEQAVAIACGWLADRYEQREALANDLEEIVEASVEAIQVWQDYESTEPRAPRSGTGASMADWLGERRATRLRAINARIERHYRDAAALAGLPTPPGRDHVLLDGALAFIDPDADAPGAAAARAAIRQLNEKNLQVRLLAQGLAEV